VSVTGYFGFGPVDPQTSELIFTSDVLNISSYSACRATECEVIHEGSYQLRLYVHGCMERQNSKGPMGSLVWSLL